MTISARPPGPKGLPLLGHLRPFRGDPVGFLLQCSREYGDIVHFKAGRRDVFLLNHPDYIKDVLVTNQRNFLKGSGRQRATKLLGQGLLTVQGNAHLRERRLVQPAFHRQRIASFASSMATYSQRHAEKWAAGETYDVFQEMMALAYSIICKALFDVDVESETTEIDAALTAIHAAEGEILRGRQLPFIGLLDRLPLPANRRFAQLLGRLDSALYTVIAERHTRDHLHNDLLSMLMDQRETMTNGDSRAMTDQQLRDEAISLFVAGHETLASALTWTWYLISQHPEVEARLHAELDAILDGQPPSLEQVPQLQYTEMVLNEVLRLYPPVWIIPRRSLEPASIGGYHVPAGSLVLITPFVTHRDPRNFPDPLRFDPSRWEPGARVGQPRFSYFPFGGGPRQCIGDTFAMLEGVIVLATLAQRWRLQLVPGHVVETQPLITLRPRFGMPMTFEQRSKPKTNTDFQIII